METLVHSTTHAFFSDLLFDLIWWWLWWRRRNRYREKSLEAINPPPRVKVKPIHNMWARAHTHREQSNSDGGLLLETRGRCGERTRFRTHGEQRIPHKKLNRGRLLPSLWWLWLMVVPDENANGWIFSVSVYVTGDTEIKCEKGGLDFYGKENEFLAGGWLPWRTGNHELGTVQTNSKMKIFSEIGIFWSNSKKDVEDFWPRSSESVSPP